MEGREGREGEGGRERDGGRDDCYTYSNRYVQYKSNDTTLSFRINWIAPVKFVCIYYTSICDNI